MPFPAVFGLAAAIAAVYAMVAAALPDSLRQDGSAVVRRNQRARHHQRARHQRAKTQNTFSDTEDELDRTPGDDAR